jgi:hypothetical protein
MIRKYCLVSSLVLFLLSPFLVCLPKVQADTHVTINEVFVHPSSGTKEWVEFFNPDGVDLANYWIDDDTSFTDDAGGSSKKSLASLAQGKDASHPYIETSSMFNNSGDFVVLFDSNGNVVDQYQYTSDPGSDVPIGRSPDGSGDFHVLASATQGDSNTTPQPTNTPTQPLQPTATNTPKPTHTPTPTKIPTPTKTPTSTATKSIGAANDSKSFSHIDSSLEGAELSADDISGMPTALLGSSISATRSISPMKKAGKEEVLVKGSATKTNQITAIIFIVGAVFLLACGILVYWKVRKKGLGVGD